MSLPIIILAIAVALYGLHRLALFAEERGWIYYRTRPPRVRMLGLLEELVEPEIGHMIEEQSSQEIRGDHAETTDGYREEMELGDFEGRTYGPVPWRVATDAVGDFIDLTGDDVGRWKHAAPPGFAAAALFAVAPELLAELYDRSVIHGEQTFDWAQPIEVGALLEVSGVVSRVRERAGVNFVTFDMEATDGSSPVVSGRSLFLVSGEALAAGEASFERQEEPPHSYRGEPVSGEVSASRADLVRYASATRDWNPVHWDHDAGVAAGFPGVVLHGLLQAGWALRAVSENSSSECPFRSARIRFRNPMLPARPAGVTVNHDHRPAEVTIADEGTEYLTATVSLVDE